MDSFGFDGPYRMPSLPTMLQAMALPPQSQEMRRNDGSFRCPQCMKRHKKKSGRLQRASHGALEIFVEAGCPICLEDRMEPPMIALACGHTVCPVDFKKLGGEINNVPTEESDSEVEEVEAEQRVWDNLFRPMRNAEVLRRSTPPIMRRLSRDRDRDPIPPVPSTPQDDDSFSDMPELEERRGSRSSTDDDEQIANEPDEEESGYGSDDIPPLVVRPLNSSSDDSSSDDEADDVPHRTATRARAHVDEDQSESSLPEGIPNNALESSDEDSIESQSEPEASSLSPSMPDLRAVTFNERPGEWTEDSEEEREETVETSNQQQGGVMMLCPFHLTAGTALLNRVNLTNVIALAGGRRISAASKIIPSPNKELVLCPSQGRAMVKEVKEATIDDLFSVANNAAVVGDGRNGVWTLSAAPSGGGKVLDHIDVHGENRVGKIFASQSALAPDFRNGGCWVHVRDGDEQGIWKCRLSRQEKMLSLERPAKVSHDMFGGLWILTSEKILYHMDCEGAYVDLRFDGDYNKDTKLIPLSNESVYVHTRRNGIWGVHKFSKPSSLRVVKQCPKDSKVSSDVNGNAYIMIKEGRERKLVTIGNEGRDSWSVQNHPYAPIPGSILGGV